jgi:tRNA 2-thiouridine synthesizing protein A
MAVPLAPDESTRTETVLRYLQEMQGSRCLACAGTVCGHQAVMSLAMGFKDAPRCLSCLAAALAQDRDDLRDHVFAYIDHHECFRAGWQWASGREGFDPHSQPACLWTSGEGTRVAAEGDGSPDSVLESAERAAGDGQWDAGHMACGDLVLELRIRLQSMRPGEVLRVTARDPGAPQDLPAWCRLTGHTLVQWEHPEYWIRRKEG